MKRFQTMVLLLFVAGPVFCAGPVVDFDRNNKEAKDLKTFVNENGKVSFPGPVVNASIRIVSEGKVITDTGSTNSVSSEGSPTRKAVFKMYRILDSGQKVEVLPDINPETGEKGYYKYKPGDNISWYAGCTGGAADQYHTVCSTYKFEPTFGGHEHSENIPGFTWSDSGKPVPVRSCYNNVLEEQAAYWYVKAPKFATRVEVNSDITNCVGTILRTIDFKVDGLALLPPASEDSLHGYTTYYTMSGQTPSHPIDHFGQPWTIDLLKQIAWQYHVEFPTAAVLNINDLSLKWGGLFDIGPENGCKYNYGNGLEPCRFWDIPHQAHQYGRQADVRRNNLTKVQRERLIEIACDHGVSYLLESKNGILMDPSAERDTSLDSTKSGPHFHFRFPRYDNEPEDPVNEQSTCKEP